MSKIVHTTPAPLFLSPQLPSMETLTTNILHNQQIETSEIVNIPGIHFYSVQLVSHQERACVQIWQLDLKTAKFVPSHLCYAFECLGKVFSAEMKQALGIFFSIWSNLNL